MKGKRERDEMTFRQKVEEREDEETYDWFQYLTEEEIRRRDSDLKGERKTLSF